MNSDEDYAAGSAFVPGIGWTTRHSSKDGKILFFARENESRSITLVEYE